MVHLITIVAIDISVWCTPRKRPPVTHKLVQPGSHGRNNSPVCPLQSKNEAVMHTHVVQPYVTRSDKIGLIAGKYMSSLNNVYFYFCISYNDFVSFIKISIHFCISDEKVK